MGSKHPARAQSVCLFPLDLLSLLHTHDRAGRLSVWSFPNQRLPNRRWLDPWPILHVIRRSCSNGSLVLVAELLLAAGCRYGPCITPVGPHPHTFARSSSHETGPAYHRSRRGDRLPRPVAVPRACSEYKRKDAKKLATPAGVTHGHGVRAGRDGSVREAIHRRSPLTA